LLFIIVSILFGLFRFSCFSWSTKTYWYLSIVCLILACFFLLLGIVLYSHQLFVGYSFILFLCSAFMYFIASAVLLYAAASGKDTRVNEYIGIVSLLIAVIFAIAAMATVGWFVYTDPAGNTLNIGLVKYVFNLQGGNSISGNLAGANNLNISPNMRDGLVQGGQDILGLGITALFLTMCSLTLVAIHLHGKPGKWLTWGAVVAVIAAIFILAGVAAYGKQLYVSASYVLYVFCSFVVFASAFLLVIGTMESGGGATTTTTTTTK